MRLRGKVAALLILNQIAQMDLSPQIPHHISEVFAVCSLTLFLPICLEQFARDNGYLLPDKTTPCSEAIPMAVDGGSEPGSEARCVVKIGWLWVDSASFR